MWWVKCGNPDCNTEYEMDMKDFIDSGGISKALTCQKCSEESIFKAVKCEKCGLVFFSGSVRGDYTDRCPECGYSETEESRKAR
jgi:predicted Zn-ribbon and HTH transcriptional regulator